MPTWLPILISGISVAFAIYSGLKSGRRADIHDLEQRAADNARINYKLDEIAGLTKEIRADISSVKEDVKGLSERMIRVEESTKSAHHRIDTLEKAGRGDAL